MLLKLNEEDENPPVNAKPRCESEAGPGPEVDLKC